MPLIRLARPFGIAAALTLALAGTALPAAAADLSLKLEAPQAMAIDPTAKLEPNSGGNLSLYIGRVGKEAAKDVVVSYDTRDLTGVAELTMNGQCTVSGTVHTCKRWQPLEYDRINVTENLTLNGAKDAKIGAKGVLHIKATSSNATEAVRDVEVFVGGPVLELKEIPFQSKVKIGSTLDTPIEITNKGSLPANRVILAMYATEGLEFKQRFGNCEYGADSGDAWASSAGMICTVDTQVAPGETVKLDPLQFGVTPTAIYTFASFRALANVETETHWMRETYDLKPGSGPRLTFGKPETPVGTVGGPNINENFGGRIQNYAELEVSADNSADFSALGQWAPAAGGRTGTLTVGMLNSGPGSVFDRSGGESMPSVRLVLPKGVTATKVPEKCHAGGWNNGEPVKDQGYYLCGTTDWAPNGYRETFGFTLELAADAVGATVPVSLQNSASTYEPGHPSAVMYWDKTPANDILPVQLSEKATGTVPPVATPTKAPTATATPAKKPTKAPPAVQPTGSRAASAVPAKQSVSATPSTPTGPLASTGGGSNAGPMIGVGIAAVVLGAVLVVLAMRRRRAGAHQ